MHTHILLSIDLAQYAAFRDWVYRCLAQLVGRQEVPRPVALLRRSYAKIAEFKDQSHWCWFRYVVKQLDPDEQVRSPFCDREVSARDIFKPRPLRRRLPVAVKRLVGVCRHLDQGARKAAGYVSPLSHRLQLYDDSGCRMPCLVEPQRDWFYFELWPEAFPHLILRTDVISGATVVDAGSAAPYLIFERAWDRLEAAKTYHERVKLFVESRVALQEWQSAHAAFAAAWEMIKLDRYGELPLCNRSPEQPPFRPELVRSQQDWADCLQQMEQLDRTNPTVGNL